ncbi:hypothetical protein AB8O64_10890 [Streptomyces sp. QH1-20]|uniref:hypothetical protein n=1 Tax=Streptomyces sp. QH1-20 TaxID=3240934 RepID=UPI0035160128
MTILDSSTGSPAHADAAPAKLYSRAQARAAINDGATMAADEAHDACFDQALQK